MRQSLTLNLSVYDLSRNTRAHLYNGYSLDDSADRLGTDIRGILDGIADDLFPGVTLPDEAVYTEVALKDIPASWWKAMKFPPDMEKAMRKFWRKNPSGSVEWS